MNQHKTRDFDRKNYFAIPCFYDSHLHLEGLGKYHLKKKLSSLKSLEDLKTFLNMISSSDLNVHEAFGLTKNLTLDLHVLKIVFKTLIPQNLSLYWVLDDGHQLLVFGPLLEHFKSFLKDKNRKLTDFNFNDELVIFKDSSRPVFDEFYSQSPVKSEATSTESHLLTAQSLLLDTGVTHCRDLTSSLNQFNQLNQLAHKNRYHIYTETFFSDFFGEEISQLIRNSKEALNMEEFWRQKNLPVEAEKGPGKRRDIDKSLDYKITSVMPLIKHKGIKIFLDGTFSQGTAHLSCYHQTDNDFESLAHDKHEHQKYSVQDLASFFQMASDQNLEVALHTMGDGAVETVLKAFDTVKTTFATQLHLEHCEVIHKRSMDYLAKLDRSFKKKLVFHFQPSHFLMDYKILKEIETKTSNTTFIFAWSHLIKLGFKVYFGSDAPVCLPGLNYIEDQLFSSFFKSKDESHFFWQVFTHPNYRQTPGTYSLFSEGYQLQSVFIDGSSLIQVK